MGATRFELATLGFGVQRSTVGATPPKLPSLPSLLYIKIITHDVLSIVSKNNTQYLLLSIV